jgi:hypothetical protein
MNKKTTQFSEILRDERNERTVEVKEIGKGSIPSGFEPSVSIAEG